MSSVDLKDRMGEPIVTTDLKAKKGLTKEEIEKMIKSLAKGSISGVIKIVEGIDDKDIAPMAFSIFDFQGFDPYSIIAVFKIICDHYGDNEKTLLSDVRYCIAACIYMGNIQSKALTKRAEEGRAKIEFLTQKYNILIGSTGAGLSAEQVTFPRVAASFPILAIRMAHKTSPKTVNLEFKSGSVPSYMRLSPFASLCSPDMHGDLRIMLMEACNAHGADMSIAYEKGRLKKLKKEIKYDAVMLASDQWSFVEIASSSPVPDEDSKKSLLTKLNLTSDYDNISKVVQNYRAIMTKKKLEEVVVLDKVKFTEHLTDYISSPSIPVSD
jgi:hypothetical protein